ncbi:MAG: hypothetical protein PHQ75_01090 [Thermoguttaceae bacterium]|nr:hypothetical protein [Thermoguttaceae bacterium]
MSDNSNNAEIAPWEDVLTDGAFDEDSQTEDSQTDDLQADDSQADDSQTDDSQTEGSSLSNGADSLAADTIVEPEKAMLVDEIATEYVGFWNRLVSQTNWEKGKVIYTWRTRLVEAGIPRNIYSDDAIAKRIGNVSGQHVGRLRRVYEQFGSMQQYPGLYWSHYQAALDWEDAQEWLGKASEESLSVASMRIARWEKYGAPADRKPKESEIVASEPDEDVNPYNDSDSVIIDVGVPLDDSGDADDSKKSKKNKSDGQADSQGNGGDDDKDSRHSNKNDETVSGDHAPADDTWSSSLTSGEVISAVSKLPELPDDLADVFEELKIAILNHKLTKWSDVAPKDVVEYLNAMRALIFAKES